MLTQPCQTLNGVGPTLASKLSACGIHSLRDLLFHLPLRYQDRTRITPIRDLRVNDWCVLVGQIEHVKVTYGKRKSLTCVLRDATGQINLRFFHFNTAQLASFHTHPNARVFGEIRAFSAGFEIVHPEYQLINEDTPCPVSETLTPIYPTTQGLGQTRLRQLVKQALSECQNVVDALEWIPVDQHERLRVMPLAQALEELHNPSPETALQALEDGSHPGLRRLALDELIANRLSLQLARRERLTLQAPCFNEKPHAIHALLRALPFTLTDAQQRVLQEISHDLAKKQPMLRLVQGDVGAGKTVIAALAAVQVIAHGHQVALMAPTDLLTEQHALTLQGWLEPLGICVLRLSGKMGVKAKRTVLDALKMNTCHCVVGTHALFQEHVNFFQLGLVIIDEQHRFGVVQRLSLQQKGEIHLTTPHQLLMTATPIPRTLAMTHFAHMDLSIIDALPPGRSPVITTLLNQTKRTQIIERLHHAITNKKQAYWVCTLIEESDKLQCVAATACAEQLQMQLPTARVGLVHGRMKPIEKEATMRAFKQGEFDLLVATTVIEVGVDVPNASIMVIENAERLGLSQLHQLRGRVGRGNVQSHCLLLYQSPLSHHAMQRLQLLRESTDGFLIAEKDWELRGAGQLLGTQQTGRRVYKIAQFPRDKPLLNTVAEMTTYIIDEIPHLVPVITKRWLGDFESFLQA